MADESIIDPSSGLFDPHAVYHSPGPGGAGSPLGGMLDFLNAFRGQDLANQAQAGRNIQQMHQAQQLAPMDYNQVPGMAQTIGTATGLGPQGAEAMSQNMPAMKVRAILSDYQQQHPGEPIPSDVMENAYVQAGAPMPTGMWGYMGRQTAIQQRDKAAYEKVRTQADAMMTRMAGQLNAQGVPEDQALIRLANLASTLTALKEEDKNQLVMNALNASKTAVNTATPKAGAQVTELGARAGLEAAKTKTVDALRDPQLKELTVRAGLEAERAALDRAAVALDTQKEANGGVAPEASRLQLLRMVNSIDLKGVGVQAAAGQPGVDPGQSRQALAQLKTAKEQLLKELEAKGKAAGGKFKSAAEFSAAFKAAQGRDPSETELARAKGKYY